MAEQVTSFDEIQVGDTAPVKTHVLTRTDLVVYAGTSGDFNPMHHDEVKAQAAGMPSVFGHGMFSMGFLGSALSEYVGVGNIVRYQVRFAKQTWPGEELSTAITVTGTRVEGEDRLVDLAVALVNADGEEKVVGEATAKVGS